MTLPRDGPSFSAGDPQGEVSVVDENRQGRAVELYGSLGTVRGVLPTTSGRRTLDHLNASARTFLIVHGVEAPSTFGAEAGATLAVNLSAILFLRELASPPVQPAGAQFARFTRAPIALRLGACTVQGFMHLPPGGHLMKRLDQDPHLFVALTSVLVTGPEIEFAAPFLAVNRSLIGAAQEVVQSSVPPDAGVELVANED